jgi:protease secretion system membrane fusion protein
MAQITVSKPNSPSLIQSGQLIKSVDLELHTELLGGSQSRISTTRFGLTALIIGFGGFLLWAGFAPLDEGVPSQGSVVIDTKKKAVQHVSGGLVKEVLVGEGQVVQEGQVLIRLDQALARANFENARQQYAGLRALEGRLLAEQQNLPNVVVSSLGEQADDIVAQDLVASQAQLLRSRRAALAADLEATEESIRGLTGQIVSYESILANRKRQLLSLGEELKNTRELVKEEYAPRNRQLELERQEGDIQSSIADMTGQIVRAQRAIAEARQRKIFRREEYRKEIESQFTDVRREMSVAAERYRVAKEDLGRIDIKSPVTGQVVGLAFPSPGAVVAPGQKLMDVVPEGQSLLVEAHVAPHLIDRVHKGMSVDVRFSSFAKTPQLVVAAKVTSVSTDLLTDPSGNNPHYLARVTVTPEGYKVLANRVLQPGMPVEVIFVTGERSMLTYLLNPLLKRIAASMKEE